MKIASFLGTMEEKTYFNTEVTFKYMPFNLQASLGYAQFLRIKELVEKKMDSSQV